MSACVGGAGSDSEFASDFVEACIEATNVPEPVCTCMAERAQEELTDDARALLLASLQGDEDTAAEIRSDMAVTEALQAGMFMTEFGTCAESMAP